MPEVELRVLCRMFLAHRSILIKTMWYVLNPVCPFPYTPYKKMIRMCGHFQPPQVSFTRFEGPGYCRYLSWPSFLCVRFHHLTSTFIRMCHTSSRPPQCSSKWAGPWSPVYASFAIFELQLSISVAAPTTVWAADAT